MTVGIYGLLAAVATVGLAASGNWLMAGFALVGGGSFTGVLSISMDVTKMYPVFFPPPTEAQQ